MNSQTVEFKQIIEHGTIQGRVQPLCDARDLHAFLDVRWDFTTWIKRQDTSGRAVPVPPARPGQRREP